jgi:hypothetical protein
MQVAVIDFCGSREDWRTSAEFRHLDNGDAQACAVATRQPSDSADRG